MDNIFIKSSLIFVACILLSLTRIFAQSIIIQNFSNGSYTPGSSIGVSFNVGTANGCIAQDNVFQLYLANATGNILPGGPIGTFTGFYGTFVNGVIPATTAPGTYTVIVKSTDPAVSSPASSAFTVIAGPAITAAITGPSISNTYPDVFGNCNGVANTQFSFTDVSVPTSGLTTTANFFNESTQTSEATLPLASTGTFTANASNYTIIVQTTNGISIATQAYLLINNLVNNSFGTTNNNTICLVSGVGAQLTYKLDVTSANGLQHNFPGNIYQISWGDGKSNNYSICDLINLNGQPVHTYTKGSCGNVANNINNVFEVDLQPQNIYCGNIGTRISTDAKVIKSPVNSFTIPVSACSNAAITFTNTSDPGEDPNANTSNCVNANVKYTWSVDGKVILPNVPLSTVFNYTFSTSGIHSVTLTLTGGIVCSAPSVTQQICIQKPPQPAFTLPATTICSSTTLMPTDNSVVDPGCSTDTYLWTVTGPAPVTYAGSTSQNSHQPQFSFSQSGAYQITLSITSANCGTFTTQPQTVYVDESPAVSLSPDVSICGNNLTYSFNTNPGPTQTTITGTPPAQPGAFNWAVTSAAGGTYSFANGTTAGSQYPDITFNSYDVYTVTVTETNSCGSVQATQHITFQQAPTVNILPSATTICAGNQVSLAANITNGSYTSVLWTGGGGTFSAPTAATTSYTPTANEISAGKATVTLDVKTSLTGQCADIPQNITINIYPVNNITSPPAQQICTGTPVNYNITANTTGSTFTWTSALTSGNATGFNAAGSGNVITDVIINNDPVNNAVITYTITPSANGCTGTPFTLTVTVNPNSAVTPTPASNTVCSGSPANISLAGNIAGTTYSWTSSSTGNAAGNGQQTTAISTSSITDVLSNNGTAAGTVTYVITPYNGNCAGVPVSVTLTVEPLPLTSTPGANAAVCNQATYSFNANNPSPGSGMWTLTSGPAGSAFDDPTKYNATVSSLVPGNTYVFTWTITSPGGCQSSSNSVTITDDAPSQGGTTSGAATVCAGTNNGNITLSGNVGNILRWESSVDNGTTWQPITTTSQTLAYSNLTVTTAYRAVVINGNCSFDDSSPTTISVIQPPTPSVAGTNQELCNTATYQLQGNTPTSGTGLWTLSSGQTGITFDNTASPTATVSGLLPGNTYQFTWTISSGSACGPSASTVSITVDPLTVAGTTSGSVSACAGNNVGNITLTGQTGNVLYWESSTDNGATWQQIVNTTTTLTYNNLTTTTQFRATVQNGVCSVQKSSISTITINPMVVQANAGPDDEICNKTSYALQGNNPGAYTGLWTVTSGQTGITFDNAASSTATALGLLPGNTYQFTWTITPVSPCAPTTSTVTIIDDLPSFGGKTSGNATVCASGNTGTITLTGQVGAILNWQSSVDNGATWQPISNTQPTLTYTNLTQTTQYEAVVQNGVCSIDYSSVTTITVNPVPVQANAGPNDEICNKTSYPLKGNDPGVYPGLWTVTSGQTGITFDNAASSTATALGLLPGTTYQFAWTITPALPCAPTTSSVTIIDDLPSFGGKTSGDATVCASGNTGTITLTGQVGVILNWQSSVDNGATWQPISNTQPTLTYTNLTQTTQYEAVVQNGVCSIDYSSVTTITVNPVPVQANAGPNDEICNSTIYTLQGNDPGPYTGLWTVVSTGPPVTFFDASKFGTTVSGLMPGNTYTFTWTVNAEAPCTPTTSSVTITDDLPSAGGNTSGIATVCAGNNAGTISLATQVGKIVNWQSSIDTGKTWQTIADTATTLNYSNLTQTTQYRAFVQNNVCAGQYSTATTITVNQPVIQANAGGNQNLCGATTISLQGNNPLPYTGTWTQTGGPPANIVSANSAATQVTNVVPGNTYMFLWTINAQPPCTNTIDSAKITVAIDATPHFTADKTDGCGNYTVNFTNTSTTVNGVNFSWDFGDGTAPSNSVNPLHTFAQRTDGLDTTYVVKLNVVGNCTPRPADTLKITVRPQNPIATIFPESLTGCSPFAISVRNTSPGNNVSYSFFLYNGTNLVQRIDKTDKSNAVFNPVSSGQVSEVYTVYMVATGFCNNTTQSNQIPITISPVNVFAQMFVEGSVNKGCAPLNAAFVNNTQGGDNFLYTIYNSKDTVVAQLTAGTATLPYTFNTPGTYYVTLTASTTCFTSVTPKTRIDVYSVPQPQFSADTTNACKTLTVNFTNLTPDNATSSASSLSYIWDFGDFSQSTSLTPPSHTYGYKNSPYTVTLTATDPVTGCSNIIKKTNLINVTSPPGTAFSEKPDSITSIPNYTFSFIDKTTGSPTNWYWTFGDGTSSTNESPDHTYPDTGLYKVTLTTSFAAGCDSTVTQNVRITGVPGQLFLPNAFEPTSGTSELKIFMAKGSGIKQWHMQIFNSYSELVWETTKLNEKGAPIDGWDGTYKGAPAPQGVYVWQVSATFINGTEWKGNVIKNSLPKRVGTINLIR